MHNKTKEQLSLAALIKGVFCFDCFFVIESSGVYFIDAETRDNGPTPCGT
jgi:hypothetical protein